MTDIEQGIIAWHKETFPNATLDAKIDKLKEEVAELNGELFFAEDLQSVLEEVADVFIVAVAIAASRDHFEENVSMSRVIADKMEVNRRRTWGNETENGDRPRVK